MNEKRETGSKISAAVLVDACSSGFLDLSDQLCVEHVSDTYSNCNITLKLYFHLLYNF